MSDGRQSAAWPANPHRYRCENLSAARSRTIQAGLFHVPDRIGLVVGDCTPASHKSCNTSLPECQNADFPPAFAVTLGREIGFRHKRMLPAMPKRVSIVNNERICD